MSREMKLDVARFLGMITALALYIWLTGALQ